MTYRNHGFLQLAVVSQAPGVPFDEFGFPDLGNFLPPRTYGLKLTRHF